MDALEIRTFLQRLWRNNRPLTAVGLAMLPLFFASIIGIFAEPRIITGAPAWLKPAKFAISIAIYLLTLAWVYGYLTIWRPLMNALSWVTALAMVVEIVIIDGQALRGTTSHFNNETPLDQRLFVVMGIAIALLWIASAIIAAALFRQPFENKTLGAAIRYGMLLTVLGSASGGAMVTPTAAQLAEAKITHRLPHAGAHTVGAPDGGPGLPVTGWSTTHGDLRLPHFMGLHGLQAMPLLAFVLIRRRIPENRGAKLVKAAAASYFSLYVLLLLQAFRGESVGMPSAVTLVGFGTWLALTLAGGFYS